MRILVAGWFSFELMGASAGDLLARDLVCRWLSEAGFDYDIALAPPFRDGVKWDEADPGNYAAVVFVCGPFGNGPPVTEFLPRFAHLPLLGVNLTMLQELEAWNPFDLLLERDSSATVRPDLVFLTHQPAVPVVGLILVHPQAEYRDRGRHHAANQAIEHLIATCELAVVPIDTRLDENKVGLRTPGEVESLIARMDAVITTRLHGMVMALKNSVPPLVVDPIAGGAKILRQARAIGWETAFTADTLTDDNLRQGLDFCLSAEGRAAATVAYRRAVEQLGDVGMHFRQGLTDLVKVKQAHGRLM